jgi:hypothetical protein
MTLIEYIDWLEQYWEIFGPPPERELVTYGDVRF